MSHASAPASVIPQPEPHTRSVCVTIDVEDFYEGMRQRGHTLASRDDVAFGVGALLSLLQSSNAKLTFFVVGNVGLRHLSELKELSSCGHEIASHGPHHGDLPKNARQVAAWLRDGRSILEDALQVEVTGFRSPRFEVPPDMSRAEFHAEVVHAGYRYMSDVRVQPTSGLVELPVTTAFRAVPIGGGSYQRLLPASVTTAVLRAQPQTPVLYYHSYDFGSELPRISRARSFSVATQILGRTRIPRIFNRVLAEFGSRTCRDQANDIR